MKIILETHKMVIKTKRKNWKPEVYHIRDNVNYLYKFEFAIVWFKRIFSIRIK